MTRRLTLAFSAAALLLAACSASTPAADPTDDADPRATQSATDDSTDTANTTDPGTLIAAPGLKQAHSVDEVDLDSSVDINLEGDGETLPVPGVTTEGDTVTIATGGTFRLIGTLSGQVVVNTTEKVALVLDGAYITATSGAALSIVEADEVTVFLADGSSNSLEDAPGNDSGAALDSSADLSITGTGTLNIVGTTNDGIATSDGLVIESGTINVTAADDGIRGKDYLVILGGEIDVTEAGGDALTADNVDDSTVGYVDIQSGTISLTSGEDGINAQTLLVSGGDLTIDAGDDGAHADLYLGTTGGTISVLRSEEGLESAVIELAGGTISIVSDDDGINAASDASTVGDFDADEALWISFSGADVTINAEGDGIDSNGNAFMSAGSLTIHGPQSPGNGAIDVVGSFDVSGGNLIAAGSAGMAETPDAASSQSFAQGEITAQAGSVVELQDSSGATIATFTALKAAQNIVFSNAEITSGEIYTFLVDGVEVSTGTAGQANDGTGGGPVGGPGGPGGDHAPGQGPRPDGTPPKSPTNDN